MPLYRFNLRDGEGLCADPDGVVLADQTAAMAYARQVAQELMRSCELKTRHWKLEVCDDTGVVLFETPFASVDHTLDHLSAELRLSVERLSEGMAGLAAAVSECRMTLFKSRAILACFDGKPYLASRNGERI